MFGGGLIVVVGWMGWDGMGEGEATSLLAWLLEKEDDREWGESIEIRVE